MKNKFAKLASVGCLLTIMHACNSNNEGAATEGTATATIDKEQVKKEIQAKEDLFAELYNKGELKDIGYYADDATSFFQNRPPLVGKDSIIAFLKSDILSNTNKISFKTKEVFVSNDGEQVVEVGNYNVNDSTGNPINTGNYMTLFVKRNGKYVALRDMSAAN